MNSSAKSKEQMMRSDYMPDIFRFLRELAVNNNRDWFHAHKEHFDDLRQLWLADLDRAIALMGDWDSSLRGVMAKDCAYRIYRDTRFSLDKTPYKTYFSAAISPVGRKMIHSHACYYLHVGIDGTAGLYGGIWCPDAPLLRKLRHAIVDNIEEFTEIIEAPDMKKYYPDWDGERLKTIPKGWDRNHPQADLLRLKEYGRFSPTTEAFYSGDWASKVAERFAVIHRLVEFINYSIEEE